MQPLSTALRAAVTGSHRRAVRVTVLDSALAELATLTGEAGYALAGSISMDRSRRAVRTLNLTIANPSGVWTPADPSSFFYWTRYLRVERGAYIAPDTIEYVPLGLFLIDRPAVQVAGADEKLTVQGTDRMRLAAKARFTVPTSYAAATPLADVIEGLASSAGMGATMYLLNDAGKTLAAARSWEVGDEIDAAMATLANDYGLRTYVNANGYLVLEPVPDPATAPIAWRFERGEEAVMLGITKEWSDDRLYNEIVVTGEAPDLAPPVRAVAQDLNPASPAYVNGPMGHRTFFYTSAMIRTAAQAAEVAAAFLYDKALIEEMLSIPSAVVPGIEPLDVIEIAEPTSRTDDRYVVDAVQIPLGAGAMTLGARKLRRLTA